MKKFYSLLLLCAITLSANAAFRTYLCGITDLSVDTLESTQKNQFIVTFNQKCKNTAEYGKPDTYYESTVKLYLNSDDRTLDGVYTTEGVDPYSTSHVNDQTINMVYSEFTSGSTSRKLRRDTVSTFVITKVDATHYAITECNLFFSQRVNQVDTWLYKYSYDANEILTEGIGQTPFVFSYEGGFRTQHIHYDMTVTGLNIERHDTDYNLERYFLTLACKGTNRTTEHTEDYEVQLAIYPENNGIATTYSTFDNPNVIYAPNCYVKEGDQQRRYLDNDSVSTVQITAEGDNQYTFYGHTILCSDIDREYQAVYGEELKTHTHYYHFDDNGFAFTYDPDNRTIVLTGNKVVVQPTTDGVELQVEAVNNVAHYSVAIYLDGGLAEGELTTSNLLSRWTCVMRGTAFSYITDEAVVNITSKGQNTYTLSASLPCENGNTYVLNAFDFGDGTTTHVENTLSPSATPRKILQDGRLLIFSNGKHYSVLGTTID